MMVWLLNVSSATIYIFNLSLELMSEAMIKVYVKTKSKSKQRIGIANSLNIWWKKFWFIFIRLQIFFKLLFTTSCPTWSRALRTLCHTCFVPQCLVPYVPRALRASCPTCSRVLRASQPTRSRVLRPLLPTCSRAMRASYPTWSCVPVPRDLRTLVFHVLRASRASCLT